jgi:hypothetical protein
MKKSYKSSKGAASYVPHQVILNYNGMKLILPHRVPYIYIQQARCLLTFPNARNTKAEGLPICHTKDDYDLGNNNC